MCCHGTSETLFLLSTSSDHDIFKLNQVKLTKSQAPNGELVDFSRRFACATLDFISQICPFVKGATYNPIILFAKSFHVTATFNRCSVKHCLDTTTRFLG